MRAFQVLRWRPGSVGAMSGTLTSPVSSGASGGRGTLAGPPRRASATCSSVNPAQTDVPLLRTRHVLVKARPAAMAAPSGAVTSVMKVSSSMAGTDTSLK